jgi:hypothetical protein
MEQNEQRHNGWTNYETWVTALWLDNDQSTQEYWQEVAREFREQAPTVNQVKDEIWTIDQAARFTLADALKEEVSEGTPVTPVTAEASLYADLIGAALQQVNWHEIAEHWLENLED